MVRCNSKSALLSIRCQLKKGHKGFHEHIERFRWNEGVGRMKQRCKFCGSTNIERWAHCKRKCRDCTKTW